jgi:phosphoribosylglycinamide formyltransferase 2
LGLPIPNIHFHGPSASTALLVEGESSSVSFGNLQHALAKPNTDIKFFGKPEVTGRRRMGVGLARANNIDDAIALSTEVVGKVSIEL